MPAPGTYTQFELTSIADADGVPVAEDMIADLVAGNEAATKTARDVFAIADAANDESTTLLRLRLCTADCGGPAWSGRQTET